MKKISFLFALCAFVVFTFCSCGGKLMTGKPGSSGKTLELMVVASNGVYQSAKHVIDTIFAVPQDGLNQVEPRFDVVQITPSSFEGNTMFQAHRNILILEVDPQGINKVFLDYDKWSTPQAVIRIRATDIQALDSMLFARQDRLLKEYYDQDYRRMEKVFSQSPNYKIIERVKAKHGFSLAIPEEFKLATMEEVPNFSWVLKQTKDFDLFLYIYQCPTSGDKDFEEASILDNLDTMMRRYVPGPSEGSYPGTERRDFFYSRPVKLGDIDAVETRGLWRTFNDFMGGPFVCYTFRSPDGKTVNYLTGAVYSPSQRNRMVMKRDLLMQVDGICRSVKF